MPSSSRATGSRIPTRRGSRLTLADQGVELAGGFDATMRRVRAKGWVFRTNC